MAEDAEEIPGRPVFSVGARVRVLAATAPGILPRLATGCGEAIVTAIDPRTREYGESLGLVFAAEVAEVAAAEAAAAETAATVEAVAAAEAAAAVESAAAAGDAAKVAADALGAKAALSPELPKEPGVGADGMADDAEEIPGRPEELKTRCGSLSSEGANAAAQAERSAPIKLLRSLSTIMR